MQSGIESVQLRLGGIGTCYNNNIDKYGTKGGGKEGGRSACQGVRGAAPPEFQETNLIGEI